MNPSYFAIKDQTGVSRFFYMCSDVWLSKRLHLTFVNQFMYFLYKYQASDKVIKLWLIFRCESCY